MVIFGWLRKEGIITKFKKRSVSQNIDQKIIRSPKTYIMCLSSSISSLGQSASPYFLGYEWLSGAVPSQPLPVTNVGMFAQAEPIKMLHANDLSDWCRNEPPYGVNQNLSWA